MSSDLTTPSPLPVVGRQATTPDPCTDLLTRTATGDQAAFEHLYDALAPRVFGLTRRVLRDHSMAEEVTQDVMIELWRTAPRYDPSRGSVSSWMLTIAHRRAVDRVRAESAGRQREAVVAARSAVIDFDSVADTADRNVKIQQVRHCLSRLTTLQRDALVLAYYNGHTYLEVAELLGISLPAVKARIRAALQCLRECVGDT